MQPLCLKTSCDLDHDSYTRDAPTDLLHGDCWLAMPIVAGRLLIQRPAVIEFGAEEMAKDKA